MPDRQEVVVKDIEMGFGSMVVFMVKWAIAAIPALLILWFLGVALFAVAAGALTTLGADSSDTEPTELAAPLGEPGEPPAAAEEPGPDPELAKFEVLSARLERVERGFLEQTVIRLAVRNGTDEPVARAFFHARYITEGRSVPWVEGAINYEISGGLEPGETAEWSLAPGMGSRFYGEEEKPGAVLEVTVTALEGPDGERLFGS